MVAHAICNTVIVANLRQCHAAILFTGERLLAEQQDQNLRGILLTALTRLMSANDLKPSLDRNNKQVFRENLGAFVVDARSVVRVC